MTILFHAHIILTFSAFEEGQYNLLGQPPTINNSYKKEEEIVVVNNSNNEKNAEIWHIFSRYGIGRNARTKKLASQPYLTPEYIERHAEHLREAGKTFPQWSGLLIRIMERGEPPPHPMFCSCKECLARLSELGIEH